MKLYFVRHGESEANIQHVISNRESTFRLTLQGKRQANAVAQNLKDIPITAIYSSPVLRATETAEILSQAFHLSYEFYSSTHGNLKNVRNTTSLSNHTF